MKNQLHNLIIASIVLLLGLSSCAAPATPLPPTLPAVCQSLNTLETPSDLSGEEVITKMVERLNAGDVTGAMAYFAEDAHFYIRSLPPIAYEENFGNEAICRTWAKYVNDKLEWNITIKTLDNIESGELITARSTIWLDSYLQLGAEPIELKESILVKDGKIVEYSRWLTKESLAQLRTVLPGSYFLRPEPAPGIASTTPGSEFDITFSDKSCVYNGPAIWKAGFLDINVEVKDDAHKYVLVFVYLQEGTDIFDIGVSNNTNDLPGARETYHEFAPKENTTIQHLVGGDRMFLVCLSTEKATHGPAGMFGPFEVRADLTP